MPNQLAGMVTRGWQIELPQETSREAVGDSGSQETLCVRRDFHAPGNGESVLSVWTEETSPKRGKDRPGNGSNVSRVARDWPTGEIRKAK